MALVVYDRVQETTATTGTGSITLGGAVDGFQSFAIVGNGNTTYYCIVNGLQWEVGLGTYSTSGPTLARTTVYSNSNGNTSPITLAGGSNVFLTYPSNRAIYEDASGNVSPLGTITSGVWNGTTIPVAYGGTGVTTSSGANSVVLRDVNQNITINRLSQTTTTVTAAGGTTTLTVASTFSWVLNGTGGQTFKLPDATTLTDTTAFEFNNNATGTLTITDNANAVVGTVASGGAAQIALLTNTTVAGLWDVHAFIPESVTWGTNALNLGTTVITNGTWNGGTIQSGYGGTGLTSFAAANNALYSTSASNLVAGTLPVAAGGTGVTSSTGSGSVVLSTSPSLTTPILGTPQSGNLANCTGYPAGSISGTVNLATQVTGTLAVANGGTGVTSSTGSGSVVLSSSPTLVSPALGTPSSLVGTNITGTASGLSIGGTALNITASSNTSLTSLANLATVGTITSGTWSGSFGAVSGANLTNITGANVTGTVANATNATNASNLAGLVQNAYSSYTNIASTTAKNGFYGILCGPNTTTSAVMFDSSGNGGFYKENLGVWSMYYSVANGSVGIMSSTTASGIALYVNGIAQAVNDFRAPLFYDSNNTAYYGDFASTSNLNALTIANGITNSSSYVNAGQLGLYNSTYGGYFYQSNATRWNSSFNGNGSGAITLSVTYEGSVKLWMYYDGSGSGMLTNTGNWGVRMNYDGGASPGGTLFGAWTANGDMRAPIFYDSADTGYYLNLNGVSNLSTNITGAAYFQSNYNTASGSSPPLQAYSNNSSGAVMAFHRGGYYAINFGLDSDNVMRIGGWSAPANLWQLTMDGNCYASGSFRAPIFYDSNDTGYYVDPNGTTSLSGVVYTNQHYIRGGYALQSEPGSWTGEQNKIQWHSSHMYFQNTSDGNFTFRQASGAEPFILTIGGAYGTASGSWRAPLFYDSNNTGYYMDPAGTTNLASIYVTYCYSTDWYRIAGQKGLYGASYGTHFYTHGTQGWTATGAATGSYAEIRLMYNYESNLMGYIYGDTTPNFGFLSNTGYWRVRCNPGAGYTGGELYGNWTVTSGNMYAPTYYDSNNAAYYGDFASTSVMNQINYTGVFFSGDVNYGLSGAHFYADTINCGYAGDPLELCYYRGAYTTTNGSMRAPIFYDLDDTGYYLNPANFSTIYSFQSLSAYTNNMDTSSGNVGMIRIFGQVATNWTQIAMSRPGVADSCYFFASDAWAPNGNAATEWIGCMSWTGRSINATGSINASGSDYAEYMTKSGDFTIAKGDVCGIDVNGELTNIFADAISFVVKSTKPSYVGGDEWGGEEGLGIPVVMYPLKLDSDTEETWNQKLAQYEIDKPIFDAKFEAARAKVDRIAFSGQVPVNVTGAVAGQYIVPVNDNGAIKGVAVNEDDLTMSQYIKAVGKVIKVVNGRPTIIVKVS